LSESNYYLGKTVTQQNPELWKKVKDDKLKIAEAYNDHKKESDKKDKIQELITASLDF
jgi:hypothetical protein